MAVIALLKVFSILPEVVNFVTLQLLRDIVTVELFHRNVELIAYIAPQRAEHFVVEGLALALEHQLTGFLQSLARDLVRAILVAFLPRIFTASAWSKARLRKMTNSTMKAIKGKSNEIHHEVEPKKKLPS